MNDTLVLQVLQVKRDSLELQGRRVNPETMGSLASMASRVALDSLAPEDCLERTDWTVCLVHLANPVCKGLRVRMDSPELLAKQERMDNLVLKAQQVNQAVRDSQDLWERLVQLVSQVVKESRAGMDNQEHQVYRASQVVMGSPAGQGSLVEPDSQGPPDSLGKTEAMEKQGCQGKMGTLVCQARLVEMVLWVKLGCQVFQALLANQQPLLLAIMPRLVVNTTILETTAVLLR